MAYNSIATNPGVMPFIMGQNVRPNDPSAQAVAARAAAGDSTPPAPVQPGVGAVAPFSTTTITDPTNQTTRIIEDDRTKSAEAAMGEAKTARLGAVDMQAEADKEAEMNAALKAQEEAKAMAAENTALKANQVERDRRLQEATAREAAQQLQVEKNAKPTGYWQDRSVPRRFIQSIFLGMDASQGGNNVAKIYADYAAEDRQRKVDALNAEVNKLAAMGKDRVRLQEYYQQRAEEISREEIANGKIMVKQIEAAGKKFPQWAAKAEAAKAVILDDTAGKEQSHAIQMAAKLTHEDKKRTVSETTGKADGTGVNWSAKEAETNANETGTAMEGLASMIEKNPEAWKAYQTAQKAELEAAATEGTGIGKLRQGLQGIGAAPVAIDQRLKDLDPKVAEAARAINSAIAPLITAKAREMDPIGALNKDAYTNASKSLNIVTAPPGEMAKKAREYGAIAGRKASAAAGAQKQPAQPQAAAPAAAPSAKSMVSGIARALKTKPGDPNYEAAQEFLKTHAPGRKGKN